MNQKTEHIVTLDFLRSELLYDIRNIGFVEADIMPEEKEHSKHQTFDIGEDGNIDRVTRVLSLAFAECVEFLYPFSKSPVAEIETRDDKLVEDLVYSLRLNVPETFSSTTVDLLAKYIHEYLVCRVLADWFGITKPEAAANWNYRVEKAKEGILDSKSIRIRKVRRGMSIF